MDKKYELTDKTKKLYGHTLHRIKALKDFDEIKKGDIGGWIESENNLSQSERCWVSDNGHVFDNGCVTDNGRVFGDGRVSDNGCVSENGRVFVDGCVSGDGRVYGNGFVSGNGCVTGNAKITGDGFVKSNEDYAVIQGFGTEQRVTTFFRCADGIVRTQCGCFYGTIDEFREQVKNTRDGKVAKEYLLAADMMEVHFAK